MRRVNDTLDSIGLGEPKSALRLRTYDIEVVGLPDTAGIICRPRKVTTIHLSLRVLELIKFVDVWESF